MEESHSVSLKKQHFWSLLFLFSRYYQRNKEHQLQNVPAVDNSLKWAGGGFLSTVSDLLQFGNAMLYSFQYEDTSGVQPPENVAYKPSPFHSINSRK